jgi:formate/nitrite transporter
MFVFIGERKDKHFKLYKTPKEATMAMIQATQRKTSFAMDKYLYLTIAAGMYVALGGLFSITVAGTVENIGLRKLLVGLTFPVALALIVFLGGELFTGNTMYFFAGWLQGYVNWHSALTSIFLSYIGNWAGTHFAAYLFGYLTELFVDEPWLTYVIATAEHKVEANFGVVLLRAIPANFLVCSAVFFYVTAEDMAGKIIGLWLPVCTFATIGFEHCIANMFYIFLGILYGADITYGEFIYKNLIPATLGNMIGGGVFLGVVSWYIYVFREDRVSERPATPLGFNLKKWTFFVDSMLPK